MKMTFLKTAFALLFGLVAPPAGAAPGADRLEGTTFAANDVDFLNLMGNHEGYRGFGTVSDYARALPDEKLTSMRIGEVLEYQRRLRAIGSQSSAVGRYQFIYPTLLRLVRDNRVSEEMIFDSEVQTYMARILMSECGFYEPERATTELGNCLAGHWAALPLLSGVTAGQSVYEGDGLNRSVVSTAQLRSVLDNRFTW